MRTTMTDLVRVDNNVQDSACMWDVRQFVVGFHGNGKIAVTIVPANDGKKWNRNACLVCNTVSTIVK